MPFSYESINEYNGTRSPTGVMRFDYSSRYFFRCLYQRALSVVKFNLPDGWNKNYFKNVLFGMGYIGIVPTAQFGVVPQICGISGYGLYLQPTDIIVSQKFVQFTGTIGEDCALIKITPDYIGICDIIEHYANQMAECFTSVMVSLVNSRAGFLAVAKNKQASETLKIIAEKLTSGEPLVVVDKYLKEQNAIDGNSEPIFTAAFDPARNYITDKLLNDMTTILNEFDREIGIPIIDDKKERRIESEVYTMISDAGTRLETWEECLNESIKECKKVFPDINISFKLKRDELIEEGVKANESNTETNANRTL